MNKFRYPSQMLTQNVAFVGSVAKNAGMKAALERELGVSLYVPPEPQITGALGAALYGINLSVSYSN